MVEEIDLDFFQWLQKTMHIYNVAELCYPVPLGNNIIANDTITVEPHAMLDTVFGYISMHKYLLKPFEIKSLINFIINKLYYQYLAVSKVSLSIYLWQYA